MRSHLLAEHALFTGQRGRWRIRGEFGGEPDWERLARRENGALLRAVRNCHRPPYLHRPRDWSRQGGEIALAPSEEGVEHYGPAQVTPKWVEEFVRLPLGNAPSLLRFARKRGLPTQLLRSARREFVPFCPVLRLQYDAAVLRSLLRIAGELRRPAPDEAALGREVRLLQLLWQDPRELWLAVGDTTDAEYPDCPVQEGEEPEELAWREALVQWGFLEERTAAKVPPMVRRAINALGLGFGRALANCSPTLRAWQEPKRPLRVEPAYLLSCEQTQLRDLLYLQAWEDLSREVLGRCACGCGSLFLLSPQQRRAWTAGDRVFASVHASRRRPKPPRSEREAAQKRARETARKRRYRQEQRDRQIAAGEPVRPRGRPRQEGRASPIAAAGG